MKKENIPHEVINLLTKEQITIFRELQTIIKELNLKTNLTRLIEGNDFWIQQVYDSIWPFKESSNKDFDNDSIIVHDGKKYNFNIGRS